MSAMRASAAAFTLLLSAAVAGSAAAQDRDEADRRFREGVRLFEQEQYPEALQEFEASRAVRETASVVLNVAGCLRALFRRAEAVVAYRRYLELRAARLSASDRREIERSIEELRRHVAELDVQTNVPDAELFANGRRLERLPLLVDIGSEVVLEARHEGWGTASTTVRPSSPGAHTIVLTLGQGRTSAHLLVSADVRGAVVWLDGRQAGSAPWSGDVAPGSHDVEVRAAGFQTVTRRVQLATGESASHEVSMVGLASAAAEPPPLRPPEPREVAARAAPARRIVVEPGPPPAHAPRGSGGSAWPWILGGAGAVLVAGSAVLLAATVFKEPLEGDVTISPP